jgi:ABC-type lipoprotein export system ATPase subunit
MPACPLAIRACDIHKGCGSGARRAPTLQGISLDVPRGETVFLVGSSGSGKTSLVLILGCVLTADPGRVVMLGAGCSINHAKPSVHVATFSKRKPKILQHGRPLNPSSLAKPGGRTSERGYLP